MNYQIVCRRSKPRPQLVGYRLNVFRFELFNLIIVIGGPNTSRWFTIGIMTKGHFE